MIEDCREPIRLLVVEDDEDLGEMLGMVLRRRGMDVTVASTAHRALEEAAAVRPHVALVDLRLVDMDGCELARRLRPSGVALVAHTGDASDHRRRLARAAGFAAYVVKPARPAELGELLISLAGGRLAYAPLGGGGDDDAALRPSGVRLRRRPTPPARAYVG